MPPPTLPGNSSHYGGFESWFCAGHAGQVGDHAPHGGPIVLPVVDNKLMYIVSIIAGTLLVAGLMTLIKARGRKSGEVLKNKSKAEKADEERPTEKAARLLN